MKELLIKIKALFEGKGEIDSASKSVGDLGSAAESTSTKTGGWLGKMGGWIAGIASFTAAVGLAGRAIQEFAAKQEAVATLDQALRNAGQATAGYRAELQKLAAEQEQLTAISDTSWYSVFETLTKMGSTTATIRQHTEAVKNMAGALGMDVEQAAFLFGKAMQGSTEMLGRYGIQVDKSKSSTEQLNQIMEQLAQRGAGILDEKGKTLNGQIELLSRNIENLLGSLGQMGAETGVLGGILSNLNFSIKWWNDLIGKTIPPVSELTQAIKLQSAAAEDLDAAHTAAAEAVAAMADAQGEQDKAIRDSLAVLDQRKSKLLELARLERDLEIEKIRSSQESESEKIQKIAQINDRFRAMELEAERNNAEAKAQIRREAAEAAARELAEAQAQHARMIAQAEAAEQAAADEQSHVARINAERETLAKIQAERGRLLATLKDDWGATISEAGDLEFGWEKSGKRFLEGTKEAEQLKLALDHITKSYEEQEARVRDIGEAQADVLATAQKARNEAEAFEAEQIKALQERAAELARLADLEDANSKEQLAHLEQKKEIEQQIADVVADRNISNARSVELAKEEEAARKGIAQAARETRSEMERAFDAQRKFDGLSNREQMQVRRDMVDKHGLSPRNADGSQFTPAQHLAGETPHNQFGPQPALPADPGMPGAAGPQPEGSQQASGQGQASVEAAAEKVSSAIETALEAISSKLAGVAERIQRAESEVSGSISQTTEAVSAASSAWQSALTNLQSRIANLEAAAG